MAADNGRTGDDPAVTYTSYLRLDDLLSLQRPTGTDHDEMLFIVVHQVYELWFAQMLWEIDHAIVLLGADERHRFGHTMNRILRILKVLVAQMDVLETMTPVEFLSFRARLDSASGFQSVQFRELEFVLGHKRDGVGHDGSPELARRREAPSLWDACLAHLARSGATIPSEVLSRDVRRPIEPNDGVQRALLALYRTDPSATELCERLVDLDEGVQEWRYRHVKMVERTIGTKSGSGGSTGAGYLRSTLGPLFPDLWAIRGQL